MVWMYLEIGRELAAGHLAIGKARKGFHVSHEQYKSWGLVGGLAADRTERTKYAGQ